VQIFAAASSPFEKVTPREPLISRSAETGPVTWAYARPSTWLANLSLSLVADSRDVWTCVRLLLLFIRIPFGPAFAKATTA
jgi:hypothetical protein